MDSITHIALGAVIGEAIAGKSIGKRAMIIGAIAQSLPDIDFIASFWLSPTDNLLAHRGITHSLFFAVIATLFFSIVLKRSDRIQEISLSKWIVFIGLEIIVHLLLDTSNAYGTGLFEPFTHDRISFNFLFVADPFFSIWSGVAFLILLFSGKSNRWRVRFVNLALVMSTLYFSYAIINKIMINNKVKANLDGQHIANHRFFSTPTPLNNWLWYIVAEADSGYYIGYRSVFDNSPSIDFHFHRKNDQFLKRIDDYLTIEQLVRFSQGYYTVQQEDDILIFNDLRFGQAFGWKNPESNFVFRYYLQKPERNVLVVQRGRFSGWNKEAVLSMIRRIKGI